MFKLFHNHPELSLGAGYLPTPFTPVVCDTGLPVSTRGLQSCVSDIKCKMVSQKQIRVAKATRPDTDLSLDSILNRRVYPSLPRCVPEWDLGAFISDFISYSLSSEGPVEQG